MESHLPTWFRQEAFAEVEAATESATVSMVEAASLEIELNAATAAEFNAVMEATVRIRVDNTFQALANATEADAVSAAAVAAEQQAYIASILEPTVASEAATVATSVETVGLISTLGALGLFGFAVTAAVDGIVGARVFAVANRVQFAHKAILSTITATLVARLARFAPKTDFWPDSDIDKDKDTNVKRFRRMERSRR